MIDPRTAFATSQHFRPGEVIGDWPDEALRRLAPTVDQAVAALVSDLAASGKLQRTMILTLSEFGRSPKINDNAGREHHPHAFSSFDTSVAVS